MEFVRQLPNHCELNDRFGPHENALKCACLYVLIHLPRCKPPHVLKHKHMSQLNARDITPYVWIKPSFVCCLRNTIAHCLFPLGNSMDTVMCFSFALGTNVHNCSARCAFRTSAPEPRASLNPEPMGPIPLVVILTHAQH